MIHWEEHIASVLFLPNVSNHEETSDKYKLKVYKTADLCPLKNVKMKKSQRQELVQTEKLQRNNNSMQHVIPDGSLNTPPKIFLLGWLVKYK